MKKFVFTLMGIALFFSACEKDNDENPVAGERFTKGLYTSDNLETLIDTETGLEWVNDSRGCFAGIVEPGSQCAESDFAGFSDWRIPTPDELSELMTEIADRGMKMNYIVSSCVLMSTSEEVWVFTENSDNPGQTTTMKPGNAGLRCVRNIN